MKERSLNHNPSPNSFAIRHLAFAIPMAFVFLFAACEVFPPGATGALGDPCDEKGRCNDGLQCDEASWRCEEPMLADGDPEFELEIDAPECSGDAASCDGTWTRVCEGGHWVRITDCYNLDKVCKEGKCVRPDEEPDGDEEEADTDETAPPEDGDEDDTEPDVEEEPDCECTEQSTCCDGCHYTETACTPEDEHAQGGTCSEGACLIDHCDEGWHVALDQLSCEPDEADGDEIEADEDDAEPEIDEEAEIEIEEEEPPCDCAEESACCDGCNWVAEGAACLSDEDAFDCTLDTCDELHACVHTLMEGHCLISDTCFAAQTEKPGFACTWCDPETVAIAWTDKPAEAPCDDGDDCTFGEACNGFGLCEGGEEIVCEDDAETCGARRACAGTSECSVSYPDAETACEDDGLDCTDDHCDGEGACAHTLQDGFCLIDGACYTDGESAPENECRYCDVLFSTETWRNKASGTECGDGETLCSAQDTCDAEGQCQPNDVAEGTECGSSPPECHAQDTCDALGNCTDRGFLENGTECDDGREETGDDQCTDGVCLGAGCVCNEVSECCDGCFAINTGNDCGDAATECSGQDTCSEAGVCLANDLAAGEACGTSDQCDGLGACVDCVDVTGCADLADDALECSEPLCEANECAHDLAAHEGELCGDTSDTACSAPDTCDAEGQCQENHEPDTTACEADALDCTDDHCDGAGACAHTITNGHCLIENACYADGADDPDSECQYCDAYNSAESWRTKPNGTNCGDAATQCSGQDTCQGGACEPNHFDQSQSCDDENDCTHTDRCDGAGECEGTNYACDSPGACETTTGATCNGDGTCDYPADTGASCDDGDDCTHTDECQSDKTCEGTSYSCNGHGTCNGTDCDCDTGFDGNYCDQCSSEAISDYPYCFVPATGYCDTNQCFPVPPTGQTNCYDNSQQISCPGTAGDASCGSTNWCGQDAQYENNTRTFTCYNAAGSETPCGDLAMASADEVVTDSLTGLMWQRTWASNKTWQQALDYCSITLNEGAGYGGFTDWRLPNPHELRSIADYSRNNPSIDTTVFPGTPSAWFWSSSSYANNTSNAWYVGFDNGHVGSPRKTNGYNARCVRPRP